MAEKAKDDEGRTIAANRRAFHEYFIEERFEAGMVLVGTEVKSLRAGRANLQDAYARVVNGECWLYNLHISPFEQGNRFNHDPVRPRKLLLHKREIAELQEVTQQKGLALVPLRLFWSKGRAKCELGVGRGKKAYDKRASLKERESRREIERVVRARG
jgi:SsrA-binding protein